MNTLKGKLTAAAEEILQKKFGQSTEVHFDVCLDQGRGDLTTSSAMQLAKNLKKKPHDIAAILSEALKGVQGVESADVAGPGFVNVTVSAQELAGGLELTAVACSPKKPAKNAKPVVIDYSQPNVAKPLAIHHILSTVIGQTLCNLYRHAGIPVVAWNYIGDWGTQFGKLAVAFELWGTKPAKECTLDELLALYVKFHTEVTNDETLEDKGREAFRKLEQGDKKLRAFWQDVVTVTKGSLADIYKRLHVTFDLDTGESYYEDKMMPVIEEGKKKKVFKLGQKDALIAEFPENTKMPPAIVLKADGATIYLTRDLAMMKDRLERFHPQAILFVVDVAQSLHFKQLFGIVEQLGWTLPALDHVFFGRMSFTDKSMSTRKGNVLKLEHVLDEAVARAEEIIKERGEKIQTDDVEGLAEMMGTGALVYGVLSQNRKMDMTFDWDKMLTFEGNSAPYVQYTHARAKSVLRKAEMESAKLSSPKTLTTHERGLVKLLLTFGDVLEEARTEHLPHKLTVYLHSVCQAFNSFYNSDEILTAAKDERAFRLGLTDLTARVLKTSAELLTIRVPDRM